MKVGIQYIKDSIQDLVDDGEITPEEAKSITSHDIKQIKAWSEYELGHGNYKADEKCTCVFSNIYEVIESK